MCSSTDGRSEASCGVIVWGGETRGGSDDACCTGLARDAFGRSWRMGGGWTEDWRRPETPSWALSAEPRRSIFSRARWSAGTRTVSRRGRSRTRAAYLEDGVHRDAAAGSTRLPRRRSPRRARLNAADVRKYFKTNRLFATREGAHPVWWSSLIRQINDDSTSRRRSSSLRGAPGCEHAATRCRRVEGQLRDERHAVLRVHGGRILRHKRAAAGAPSGGTRIDESRRVAIPTRANNTNTPNPPHASHPQGRNDVRDAKADVTDVRAPGKTQRVRRKNRAFDLEAENEVRVTRRFFVFALFFVRLRLLGG